jgi:homocysteine S-methyltransferase
MLTRGEFNALLASKSVLVIDGALASELEERGHDLNHPLWSAKILRDDPDSIEKVHLDYFLAGADIAITASYQAAPLGLTKHFGTSEDEGKGLVARSVTIANSARKAAYEAVPGNRRQLLLAGSIGPYGAYLANGSEYSGEYSLTPEKFQSFHRPRIQALIDAEVDLLALETMPSYDEIKAVLDLLHAEFPRAIGWLGCTTRDASHLSDGTPLQAVVDLVHENELQIIAIGVNCVASDTVSASLHHLSQITHIPLLCYPNSGEVWDASTKTWSAGAPGVGSQARSGTNSESTRSRSPVMLWIQNGARLVGGCCRTGPAFIRSIREDLEESSST